VEEKILNFISVHRGSNFKIDKARLQQVPAQHVVREEVSEGYDIKILPLNGAFKGTHVSDGNNKRAAGNDGVHTNYNASL
jgi:hypothetical protein